MQLQEVHYTLPRQQKQSAVDYLANFQRMERNFIIIMTHFEQLLL